MATPIRFVQISDTHFGPTKDFTFHGKTPYSDGLKLVEEINRLPFKPDFVIHTGDLISFQHDDAYSIAEEVLKGLNVPMYFTTGNHDDPILLNKFSLFASRNNLSDIPNSVSYSFEFNKHLFIVIDAKHPDDANPSGVISDLILQKLANLLETNKLPFTIFTHFPPLHIDAPWMDKNLLISNGNLLHEIITKHSTRSCGVFFGHIHQPLQIVRDGITYISAPSTTFQFGGWPTDNEILSYNDGGVPGVNIVSIQERHLVSKFLTLPIKTSPGNKNKVYG